MKHELHVLGDGIDLHRFGDCTITSLLVCGGRSLMVDCHDEAVFDRLAELGVPEPDQVIHTHVQATHCRESLARPDLPVAVPESLRELASDRDTFARAMRQTWEDPEDWGNTMGREPFGIGGSPTYAPPAAPLKVARVFTPGDALVFQGLTLDVIALPVHMAEAVGFVLRCGRETLACFTGDLMMSPDELVNLYDLEHAYGMTRLPDTPGVLRALADSVDTDLYLPATGPVIRNGRTAALRLADRIDVFLQTLDLPAPSRAGAPVPAQAGLGRWEQLGQGLYQFQQPGNAIVFIDDAGRGLMIDPGPCDYESASRESDFLEDLTTLEKHAGLRCIDQVLITHMHGDHYDLLWIVLERYADCRVGAWAPLARLIEHPQAYPYACLLPWYSQNPRRYQVDDVLRIGTVFNWHGVQIETVHLPGHCLLHAGYLLSFRGQRIAITGDTVMTDGDAMPLNFVMANHGTPTGRAGVITAFEQMSRLPCIDLNLCGHGMRFSECSAMYEASLSRMRRSAEALQALFGERALESLATRPSFPPVSQAIAELVATPEDASVD